MADKRIPSPVDMRVWTVEQRVLTRAIRALALNRLLSREINRPVIDEDRVAAATDASIEADADLYEAVELLASERGIDIDGVM